MGKKNRHRRHLGHYCWCCDRNRSNEKFSGKGRARHLCKDCSRLGSEELAFRQARRNLERCLTWDGIIPRKRRKQFARFLDHDDHRIREIAREMQQEDERVRLWLRIESESSGPLDFDGGNEDVPFDEWDAGDLVLPFENFDLRQNIHESDVDLRIEEWGVAEIIVPEDNRDRDVPFWPSNLCC